MTTAELRRRRAAAQGLAGGDRTPAAAVSQLLAVQAQDLRAARLALRARGAARAAVDVDAALTAERSLVSGWLMRGTLHLVAAEDHGWLHALTGRQTVATCERRLAGFGVGEGEAERAIGVIEGALADAGPLVRGQLSERLGAAGIAAAGRPADLGGEHRQVVPHLLALAAARGTIVLGPVRDGAHAFALARDWLGPPARVPDRAASLAELARRYLRGHGPARAADLASWSGLPLRDVRAGLAAIAGELEQHGDLVDLASRPAPPGRLPPRLLGAFDPYLLGWRDRAFAVDPADAHRVHPGGGIIRATAIANGRAVATWTLQRGRVALAPFAPLPPRIAAALDREADRVAHF